ncbi:MAG: hypothetical protein ACOC2U_02370 [bacterium]
MQQMMINGKPIYNIKCKFKTIIGIKGKEKNILIGFDLIPIMEGHKQFDNGKKTCPSKPGQARSHKSL